MGQLGQGFASARITMPIDEPLGPAFTTNSTWGVHLGGGLAF